MKTIEIEDDLYHYIASQTQDIGESASAILRRLLVEQQQNTPSQPVVLAEQPLNRQAQPENSTEKLGKPATSQAKNVFDVLNKEEVVTQKGAVGRFLFVLAALYRCHPDSFDQVLDVKGRERAYFAKSAAELEASGSSIKPKQIAGSPYWVTTNNNTPRKKLIITEVASVLGYQQSQAEQLRELI